MAKKTDKPAEAKEPEKVSDASKFRQAMIFVKGDSVKRITDFQELKKWVADAEVPK